MIRRESVDALMSEDETASLRGRIERWCQAHGLTEEYDGSDLFLLISSCIDNYAAQRQARPSLGTYETFVAESRSVVAILSRMADEHERKSAEIVVWCETHDESEECSHTESDMHDAASTALRDAIKAITHERMDRADEAGLTV